MRWFTSKFIAIVLIGAAVLVGAIGLVQINSSDDEPPPPALTDAGSATMDEAAQRLAEPGLFVAQGVPYSRISGDEFTELKATITEAELPVRVAVLPVSITRDGQIDAARLTDLLHKRVSKPGVYAVLVDDRGEGILGGAYWPTKDQAEDTSATSDIDQAVADAVTDANDCCSRDYPAAIDTFVEVATDTPNRAGAIIGWFALILAAGAAGAWWIWRRQDADPESDDEVLVVTAMGPIVRDEISELEFRVAALPGAGSGTGQPPDRSVQARKLLATAQAQAVRLAANATLAELVATVRVIADIRFELYAIEQLRLGFAAPDRAQPCFIDPRHGPCETSRPYAPTGLEEREVQVCRDCAHELDGHQRPAIRGLPRLTGTGALSWANYWEADAGRAYVEGYWGTLPFPDEEFETGRAEPIAPRRPDPIDVLRQRLRTDQD